MSSTLKLDQLLLDNCRRKYSWASGATRGTPSARDRHQKDLEIAFSEINGLMAGMQYQDQKHSHLKVQHDYASEISEDDLLIEEPTTSYPAPPEPTGVMEERSFASQWAAIRTLREETEFHHKKFRDMAANHLHDPIISGLLEQYPNSSTIRNTGAQLVKDVLEGFRPTKLSHVFAFTSFSYAISKLLYKKERLKQDDILADLKAWRDLILDKREKQAFNRLAPELWPESRDHLHFIDIPEESVVSPTPFPATSPATDLSSSLDPSTSQHLSQQTNGESTAGSSMNSVYGSYDLSYIAMPSTTDARSTVANRATEQLISVNNAYDFSALSQFDELEYYLPIQLVDTGWPQQRVTSGYAHDSSHRPSAPRTANPHPAELDSQTPKRVVALEETVLFLVVFAFLQDIVGLLNVLSGRNFLGPQRHKLFRAQQGAQEVFYHSAKKTFFEPFCQSQDSGKPACMALLSVADKFTKQGYLQTFSEIQHYLVTLATVALPPGEIFVKFVAAVVSHNALATTPSSSSHSPRKRMREEEESLLFEHVSPPTKKQDLRCEWEGCNRNGTYTDSSGLRKHMVQCHIKPNPILCGHEGCEYGNARRDRVRTHFLSQHPGVSLPKRLEATSRTAAGQEL